jgi:hypothetical protein
MEEKLKESVHRRGDRQNQKNVRCSIIFTNSVTGKTKEDNSF